MPAAVKTASDNYKNLYSHSGCSRCNTMQ